MVNKVVPIYPFLAQKMGIAGSVKIEALVAPTGNVKSAEVLGGHPVLLKPVSTPSGGASGKLLLTKPKNWSSSTSIPNRSSFVLECSDGHATPLQHT